MIICENLFESLDENKKTYEYHQQLKNLVAFERVKKNYLPFLLALKNLIAIFAGFEQAKNLFRRNSVTYGTPR